MYYGIDVPNFGEFSDITLLVDMAQEAEQAGWDGFFLWDHISLGLYPVPIVDTWVALAAIAARTERIRLGPMVTPLPRRRPSKVAREAVSLDHLSDGRLILGVGAGAGYAWENLGEEADAKERAAMLDEALEVLTGLWTGEPFSYQGTYYQVKDTVFVPTPVQSPGIPIWVAGVWPKRSPLRRAARWDGVVPSGGDYNSFPTPEMIRDISSYIDTYRTSNDPFDIVIRGGRTTGDHTLDQSLTTPYAEAGATWWFENVLFGAEPEWDIQATRQRIRKGPPSSLSQQNQ